MWRKGLSLLCGLTALTVAGNWLFFAINQEASQVIWDYVADPAVLVLLALTILVNLRDSLQARNKPNPFDPVAAGCHHSAGGHGRFPLSSTDMSRRWRPARNRLTACGHTSTRL